MPSVPAFDESSPLADMRILQSPVHTCFRQLRPSPLCQCRRFSTCGSPNNPYALPRQCHVVVMRARVSIHSWYVTIILGLVGPLTSTVTVFLCTRLSMSLFSWLFGYVCIARYISHPFQATPWCYHDLLVKVRIRPSLEAPSCPSCVSTLAGHCPWIRITKRTGFRGDRGRFLEDFLLSLVSFLPAVRLCRPASSGVLASIFERRSPYALGSASEILVGSHSD